MKNAVTLIGQLGETGLTMRYGFYRWKIVTEKLRAVKGERSRVSVYNAAGGFDAEHPGENDDRVTQLLEASKFEVHARIIDEQKRHRRTPDELVSSYCSTVEYVGERSENFPRPPPEKSTAPLPPSRRPPTQAPQPKPATYPLSPTPPKPPEREPSASSLFSSPAPRSSTPHSPTTPLPWRSPRYKLQAPVHEQPRGIDKVRDRVGQP